MHSCEYAVHLALKAVALTFTGFGSVSKIRNVAFLLHMSYCNNVLIRYITSFYTLVTHLHDQILYLLFFCSVVHQLYMITVSELCLASVVHYKLF